MTSTVVSSADLELALFRLELELEPQLPIFAKRTPNHTNFPHQLCTPFQNCQTQKKHCKSESRVWHCCALRATKRESVVRSGGPTSSPLNPEVLPLPPPGCILLPNSPLAHPYHSFDFIALSHHVMKYLSHTTMSASQNAPLSSQVAGKEENTGKIVFIHFCSTKEENTRQHEAKTTPSFLFKNIKHFFGFQKNISSTHTDSGAYMHWNVRCRIVHKNAYKMNG